MKLLGWWIVVNLCYYNMLARQDIPREYQSDYRIYADFLWEGLDFAIWDYEFLEHLGPLVYTSFPSLQCIFLEFYGPYQVRGIVYHFFQNEQRWWLGT
jgi:hypothetical protein